MFTVKLASWANIKNLQKADKSFGYFGDLQQHFFSKHYLKNVGIAGKLVGLTKIYRKKLVNLA